MTRRRHGHAVRKQLQRIRQQLVVDGGVVVVNAVGGEAVAVVPAVDDAHVQRTTTMSYPQLRPFYQHLKRGFFSNNEYKINNTDKKGFSSHIYYSYKYLLKAI